MGDTDFNTGNALAFFITWTTYGTWLPGDERGWNQKGAFSALPSDPLSKEAAKARMKETAFGLLEIDRLIVKNTIAAHCKIRGWQLHAVNVRSNHVHVVATTPEYAPATVASQFKAWCTRKLQPSYPGRNRFWTQGASGRWINQPIDLTAAIEYTLEAQDQKGEEYQ